MRVASPHPDRPGLRGGARPRGFWPAGTHVCTEHDRVCACHLWRPPRSARGSRARPWGFWPWQGAMLPNLPAQGSNRGGPDLGLAALPPGPTCCVLSPTLGQRPFSPGQPSGPAKATSGCGHIVYACAGVRDAHCLCLRNSRGSAFSPRSGAGPQMATWFSVAFPVEHGSWGGPSPPRGPGCWRLCRAVPGMGLPAFLVRRVAPESYLLCLWHQLLSWSRGSVRETRAQGPEDSSWTAPFLLRRLATSHPLLCGHDRV